MVDQWNNDDPAQRRLTAAMAWRGEIAVPTSESQSQAATAVDSAAWHRRPRRPINSSSPANDQQLVG